MNRYQLRAGTPADGKALLRVHRRSILALGTIAYTKAEVRSWADGLVAEGYGEDMADENVAFLVAVDDEQGVVGFCSYKDNEVTGLYVDPAHARRGVGRSLLRRAEAAIAAEGHGSVDVAASLVAQSFYESEGYSLKIGRAHV